MTNDAQGFAARAEQFFEWMRFTNYSERTVENRQVYLKFFFDWCEERGVMRPSEVTKPILERYQRYLYHYLNPRTDQPLSFRSQFTRLVPIRAFFKWLARHNHILYNPAGEIDMPRLERRLPRYVLNESEAERVINQPDMRTPIGVRDRAILETFYSTGMRRMELVKLCVYNIDTERGTVMIRQGKGKKDRMIPIGERALLWIQKYLYEVRPQLLPNRSDATVFLTAAGDPFDPGRLTQLVRTYVNAANVGKKGACHLFRHTMATLMLEHGADIRFIQEMLGHVELSTTQIYTQVSIRKLKEIHTLTHPARMQKSKSAQVTAELKEELHDALDEDQILEPAAVQDKCL